MKRVEKKFEKERTQTEGYTEAAYIKRGGNTHTQTSGPGQKLKTLGVGGNCFHQIQEAHSLDMVETKEIPGSRQKGGVGPGRVDQQDS